MAKVGNVNRMKEISSLAKKIREKNPTKKWTDCISQASKEISAAKK